MKKKLRLSLDSNIEGDQQPLSSAYEQLSISKASKGPRPKCKDFFAGVPGMNDTNELQFGEDSQKRMQDLLDEVNSKSLHDLGSLAGRKKSKSKRSGLSAVL